MYLSLTDAIVAKTFFKTKTITKMLNIIVTKTIAKTKIITRIYYDKTKTKTKLYLLLKVIRILKLFSLRKQHYK